MLLAVFLAACGGGTEDTTVNQQRTTLSQSLVEIIHPPDSTIVYAETLYVSGTVAEAPQQFMLELVNTDSQVIFQTVINAQTENWEAELVHGYVGVPDEILLRAIPEAPPTAQNTPQVSIAYDTATILLSDISNRPEGIIGIITLPPNGTQTGGDTLLITGRASGVPDNTFLLELVGDGDEIIDSREVTLTNPYLVDEIPWEFALATNNYTGQATIRMVTTGEETETTLLDSIVVTVTHVAG